MKKKITMIKYEIKTGSKHLNTEARQRRDTYYKPFLRGMFCRNCNNDTIIRFVENHDQYVIGTIYACCPIFNERIIRKLA